MRILKLIQVNIKYIFDRFISILMLVALSPVFLIISCSIKMDDKGPVFFKQQRLGLNEKPFIIWKFRTMVPNADKLLDDKGRPVGGNRVTRVGKWLRKTSLDELPQLINIAKGEMSFIGPRPVLVEHLSHYTKQQRKRFLMKPGITGLAQVNGRNTLPWSMRLKYDVKYVENYSLCLDIKILLKTFRVVLLGQGIVLDRNPEQVDDLGLHINKSNKHVNGGGV